MKKHLTEEQKQIISTCQYSNIELSRKLGFSTRTIYVFAKNNNLVLPKEPKPARVYHVIIGKKYGLITPLEKIIVGGITKYKCNCECGSVVIREPRSLFLTRTPSCGCYMDRVHMTERKGYGEASAHVVFLNYKANALRRNLSFSINEQQFKDISQGNCFYCGSEPSNYAKRGNSATPFIYNGVDRKNNNNGYEINNVVSCCKKCNVAKAGMNIDDFSNWVSSIYKNIKKWENKND